MDSVNCAPPKRSRPSHFDAAPFFVAAASVFITPEPGMSLINITTVRWVDRSDCGIGFIGKDGFDEGRRRSAPASLTGPPSTGPFSDRSGSTAAALRPGGWPITDCGAVAGRRSPAGVWRAAEESTAKMRAADGSKKG